MSHSRPASHQMNEMKLLNDVVRTRTSRLLRSLFDQIWAGFMAIMTCFKFPHMLLPHHDIFWDAPDFLAFVPLQSSVRISFKPVIGAVHQDRQNPKLLMLEIISILNTILIKLTNHWLPSDWMTLWHSRRVQTRPPEALFMRPLRSGACRDQPNIWRILVAAEIERRDSWMSWHAYIWSLNAVGNPSKDYWGVQLKQIG